MSISQATYRGLNYNPQEHESASKNVVEHIYRGKRYQASLKHAAVAVNPSLELHYRGSVYHHRLETSQESIKN